MSNRGWRKVYIEFRFIQQRSLLVEGVVVDNGGCLFKWVSECVSLNVTIH